MTALVRAIVRWVALWLLRGYQVTLGQVVGGRCRFYPSCSNYAMIAFELHPPHRAGWLTLRRVCRCHPMGGHGVDPVPEPGAHR